jgi:hypothetical protein
MKKSWIKDSNVRYVLENGQHKDHPVYIVLMSIDVRFREESVIQNTTAFLKHIPWSHFLHMLCSVYRNDNPILSSFMIYHRVCNNTMGISSGAETVFYSGASEFTSGF